jgi:hypothetical protein
VVLDILQKYFLLQKKANKANAKERKSFQLIEFQFIKLKLEDGICL